MPRFSVSRHNSGGNITFLLLTLVALAYLAAYLLEHRSRAAAESNLRLVNAQLADAEGRLGICGIENQPLSVLKKVGANNYGDALKLSPEFFDGVPRTELF